MTTSPTPTPAPTAPPLATGAPPAPVATELPDADASVGPEAEATDRYASASALAVALAAGSLTMFRVRRSGTLRRLPYLAPNSEAREVAHWYALRLEEGASLQDVAAEAAVRPLTVRRALWSLDLAEAIEDGDLDELWDGPDDTHQFVLQVSHFDYPYGDTPLTDPTNVQFVVLDEDGTE